MKVTRTQLFIISGLAILYLSCSGRSLTGRWKLRQVDLIDVPSQTNRFTLDLTKPDEMKAKLSKERIPEEQHVQIDSLDGARERTSPEDTSIDVNDMKSEIDKWVASSLNTEMTLERDNKFYMISNGLIVPTVAPGWRFVDTIQGNWTRNKDTLILSIGDGNFGYRWKFKIMQVTSKDLQLQEVFDGFKGRGNELRFVRH